MMKKIALIYMGGTFGCVGEPLSPMPADEFLPQLKKVLPLDLTVECMIAPVIKDSSACTPADWLQLIQFVQRLQLQQFQHFVLIHGTDTMSYACAILSRFLGQSAHVVLTGSQYPLLNIQGTNTREFTDAIDNLSFALHAVQTQPVGVYLAFHQQLFHGRSVLKQHTTELDAFSGLSSQQELRQPESAYPVQAEDLIKANQFNCLNLMMQPIALDQQLQNIKTIAQHPPSFLILQGFGTGNISVNADCIECFKQLRQQGCMVLLTTQVSFGKTDQRYAISSWIQDAGVVVSDCISHADLYAKALLMYLKHDSIDQCFTHWHDSV
ncbi:asparaginase [Acinetobacter tibetensis]|uniref:Asparaginase n=1 Tax=Acinetobacter tibetensis TaxID=2943497 RepID=A0AAE9LU74_9GAMM|nr:asparaginase [Acinetobacter tibetensis]USE84887.1 asparaginase [Acinetobacter tibetensis]